MLGTISTILMQPQRTKTYNSFLSALIRYATPNQRKPARCLILLRCKQRAWIAGLYIIANHKMVLIPVQDAGQFCFFFQLFQCDAHTIGAESNALCGIADTQHRDSLARDETLFAKRLQCVVPTIVLGYHAQARWSAVHHLVLEVVGETLHC